MGNKFCSCFKPKVDVESTGRRSGLFKSIKVQIFGGKKDATVAIETSATTQDETDNNQEEVLGKMERASLFCVTPNFPAASSNGRALPIEQRALSAHKTTASKLPHQKLVPESKEKCETAEVTFISSKEAVAVPEHTEEQTKTDNKPSTTFCQTEPVQPLIADSVPDDDIQNKKEVIVTTADKSTTDDNIATQEPGRENKDDKNILIKTSDLAASVPASTEYFELKTRIPECICPPTITADKTLSNSDCCIVLDHGNDLAKNDSEINTTNDQTAPVPASTEDLKSQTDIPNRKYAPTLTANENTISNDCNTAFDHERDQIDRDEGQPTSFDQTTRLPAYTEEFGTQKGVLDRKTARNLSVDDTTTDNNYNTTFDHRKDLTDNNDGLSSTTDHSMEDFKIQTVIADRKNASVCTANETTSKNDKDTYLDHDKYLLKKNEEQITITEKSVSAQSSKKDTEPNRNRDIQDRKVESTKLNDIIITNNKDAIASAIREEHKDTDSKENMTFEKDESTYVNNTKVFSSSMCFTSTTTFTTGKTTSTIAPEGVANKLCKEGVNSTKVAYDVPDNILNVPRDQENKTENVMNCKNTMHIATTTICKSNLATRTSTSYKGMTDTTTSKGNNKTTANQSNIPTTTSTSASTSVNIQPVSTLKEGTVNKLFKDIVQDKKKTTERDPSKATSTDNFINTLEKDKISKALSEIPTFKAANSSNSIFTTICKSNLATRTSTSYKGITDATTSKGNNKTTANQSNIPTTTSASASTSVNIQPVSTLKEGTVNKIFKDIVQDKKRTTERDPSKATSTDSFINTLEKDKISKALSEIPTFKAANSSTGNVSQMSTAFDKSKSVGSTKVSIYGKEKADNDMRKVISSHKPSVSSTEALETLRKLAKMLAAAKSSADLVSQSKLTDDKNSTQRVKQQYKCPAVSMSHTTATSISTATTNTSVEATVQLPSLPCSNTTSRKNITKCQSLPAITDSREGKKVSDFVVPKAGKAAPMKPLKIKPQPKHLYAVPTIAKTDIENEVKKNWTQHDSTSDKAQMPWMSRRPQFDVTFPKPGKTLLQSLGSVDKILAHRVVPLPKRIELLKVEVGRFPGLRIKPNDVRKYPSIFNLTPSQTCLHEETDEHEEER